MITATVEQCREAYRALRSIGATVPLQQKPAWRVSRLLGQLKPVVTDFEETQLKLFMDVGGTQGGGGVVVEPLERNDDEGDAEWRARRAEFRATMNKLQDELRALNKETVEINYDALPLSLFKDDPNAKDKKAREFLPNDLADLGPFIVDDEEVKPKE